MSQSKLLCRITAKQASIVATIAIIGMVTVLSTFFLVSDSASNSYATSVNSEITAEVDGTHYVTLSAPDVTFSINPTDSAQLSKQSINVSVETNAPGGADLYLSMANSTNALHLNGDTASAAPAIEATASSVASNALAANTWGYSTDDQTYSAVPTNNSDPALLAAVDGSSVGSNAGGVITASKQLDLFAIQRYHQTNLRKEAIYMSYTSQADPMQAMVNAMTPKFAVSYLRVSTRGQAERGGGADEGFSIPAQREANKRKALSMGAMVGKEFVDRGASARSADRPELQKMLEYIKENADRVDYVIVHKVDRLARNRGDDIDIMRTLDECDVQLVSASESIDNSPSGMLLHGIMSAIAEFYSQNLATEVKKGMGEKIKNGGTVGRAPIGYKNVRDIDEKGREARTVAIDPERAPLIKLAFEEYSTGQWTVADLAEHLAACGLNTRSTPRIPSQPITLWSSPAVYLVYFHFHIGKETAC